MTAFLTGSAAAILLSALTYLALAGFSQTSIERIVNPSVNLDGVDQDYSPMTDTNVSGIAGDDS